MWIVELPRQERFTVTLLTITSARWQNMVKGPVWNQSSSELGSNHVSRPVWIMKIQKLIAWSTFDIHLMQAKDMSVNPINQALIVERDNFSVQHEWTLLWDLICTKNPVHWYLDFNKLRLVVKDKGLCRPGVVHLAGPAAISNNSLSPYIRALRLSLGDKFPKVEIQVVPTTHLQGQVTEKFLSFIKSSPLVLKERHFGDALMSQPQRLMKWDTEKSGVRSSTEWPHRHSQEELLHGTNVAPPD